MRRLALTALALMTALPLAAQEPPPAPVAPDTGDMMMVQDPARAQMLRQQIEMRFGQMVQQQLQLTDPQMLQLKGAMRAHQERRRELGMRQQMVNQAIRWQMRPGIAADQDSLARLSATQNRLRIEHAQQEELLERDLSFLTPVQRVQFMQMMRNFEQRIQQIRMQQQLRRQQMGGGFMGPAARPMPMRRPGRRP